MGNKIVTEADRKRTPPVKVQEGIKVASRGRRPEGQPGARHVHAQQEEPGQAPPQGRLNGGPGAATAPAHTATQQRPTAPAAGIA